MADMLTELDRAIRRENGEEGMQYEPGHYVFVAFHKGDMMGVYHSKEAAVEMLDKFGAIGPFTLVGGRPAPPAWGREGQQIWTVRLR